LKRSSSNANSDRIELPIEDRVQRAKVDGREKEYFILDYHPFMVRVTSQFAKRYIDPDSDELFSVALQAFNEALDAFRIEAGKSFFKFAETVIHRRLIDFVRKEARHRSEIPLSSLQDPTLEEDESHYHPGEVQIAKEQHQQREDASALKDEIKQYQVVLAKFELGFEDLVAHAPKHEDTRRSLWKIAHQMIDEPSIYDKWTQSKRLPMQSLATVSGFSIKMLEKHRKTLLAYALLLMVEFPYLRSFVGQPEQKGGGER